MLERSAIPWEELDGEIRPLVALLNAYPGIETQWSCAGHGAEDEAYVSFTAESQDDLRRVLLALPPKVMSAGGYCAAIAANQFQWRRLAVTVSLDGDRVSYALRLTGGPEHMRFRLLEEVERSLREAQSLSISSQESPLDQT
jgi:hypothetical protein